jgi:hypothetical protein
MRAIRKAASQILVGWAWRLWPKDGSVADDAPIYVAFNDLNGVLLDDALRDFMKRRQHG